MECHFDRKNLFQQILKWRNLAVKSTFTAQRQDFSTALVPRFGRNDTLEKMWVHGSLLTRIIHNSHNFV